MSKGKHLDCVVIGYNETPFEEYECLLRKYGEGSEAYRDLKLSFIDLDDKKLDYIGLLNYIFNLANQNGHASSTQEIFKSGDIPNLACVYLANFLRKRGYQVRYINLFQDGKEELAQYLLENPLCVAITTTFYLMNHPVKEIIRFIRKQNESVRIIVGGPLISNHARNYQGVEFKTALEDIGADIYIVESQGELTLAQVIQHLKSGRQLKNDLSNVIYVENGKLQWTMSSPENNSLDENFIKWRDFSDEHLGPTLQTRTARSCAFNCAFCNYPARAGKLTLANLKTIEKELDAMQDLGYVENVVFIDDTFNVPVARFKDICRLMIRKDYQFNWFSYFRCSNSDEEAIELMAESGCKGVFLGIESGSPTILKNMTKVATIDQYVNGLKLLHQYDILTFVSLISGFPGETDDTVNETIDFIKAVRPHYYRSQLWYCEAGTPINDQSDKYGIKGEGFVWSHATMDSLAAMGHIERMFLTIQESVWLPQWSFDFWIIPYLFGKGISLEQFRNFTAWAQKLLKMEITYMPKYQKSLWQQEYLQQMVKLIKN